MCVKVCKWYDDVDSPVLLLVDDLANVWVDVNGNGEIDLGEDWGYGKTSENSSFKFLNEIILNEFKKVKVTFFLPVGIRVGMISKPKIKSISKMINCDDDTKEFFKAIHENPKYEVAYHGTTHGRVGESVIDFKQEWELFRSTDEAVAKIKYGKEIYKDVFDEYPKGGKYCGYSSNEFSDESIDNTGFLWWCRYYNRGFEKLDPITNFDIKIFGENQIIDIPSTVDGGVLTGILKPNLRTVKGIGKKILKKYLIKRKLQDLEYLLNSNLIISIQEHMSPARDDGKRQTPNIFDDKESLWCIFNYLKDKNVWYCTGTELAEYYWLREHIDIRFIERDKFVIVYYGKKKLKNSKITVKFSNDKINRIKLPNGNIIEKTEGHFNVNILQGVYRFL